MDHKSILTSMVVFALLIAGSDAAAKKNRIEIRNNLAMGKLIKVHCASKGFFSEFKIVPTDDAFIHSFNDTFFMERVIYRCKVWHGDAFEHHQWFQSYKAKWYPRYGVVHRFEARPDGIYVMDGDVFVPLYAWDVPHE